MSPLLVAFMYLRPPSLLKKRKDKKKKKRKKNFFYALRNINTVIFNIKMNLLLVPLTNTVEHKTV